MAVFNYNNKQRFEGKYPLFLGAEPALHDSINTTYPQIFKLYKKLKSVDWSEDEVDLQQSRFDFENCPKNQYEVMVKTLAYQWELDSIASRSIAPLLAPFISNSEYWAAISYVSQNECLTEDAEVLTRDGWVLLSDVKMGDEIMTFDPTTKTSYFDKVTNTTAKEYTDDIVIFTNQRGHFYQAVTKNHRMPVESFYTGDVWFTAAKDVNYHGGNKFILGAKAEGEDLSQLSPVEQFKIAFQADGHWSEKYNGGYSGYKTVRFGFIKQRKIDRLHDICHEAGFEITEMSVASDTRHFTVKVPKDIVFDKEFSWVTYDKSGEWYASFLEELYLWDGYTPDEHNFRKYINTNKQAVEKVRDVVALAGKSCHIRGYEYDNDDSTRKTRYDVCVIESPTKAGNIVCKSFEPYDGMVYCATVPTGAFIVKQGGCISITGNCLHSLTYSEIGRQCFKNPEVLFAEVERNEVTERGYDFGVVFKELEQLGAKYNLGIVNKNDPIVKETIAKTLVALYALEGISFMASFACTFALAQQDLFIGVAKLVQKIMIDEQYHTQLDKIVIDILQNDPEWKQTFKDIKPWVKEYLDKVVQRELNWNEYLFSEGRSILGLNKQLLDEWVIWSANPLYQALNIQNDNKVPESHPIPWLNDWIDIDSHQVAAQEATIVNYVLNATKDDLGDDELDFD